MLAGALQLGINKLLEGRQLAMKEKQSVVQTPTIIGIEPLIVFPSSSSSSPLSTEEELEKTDR